MRGSTWGPGRPVRASLRGRPRREAIGTIVFVVVSFVASAEWTGVFAVPMTAPSSSDGGSGVTAAAQGFPTPIQHVVVVMMENQDYTAVLQQGPFEAYLAKTYATATNDYSLMHYSIPSYQAATSAVAYSNWTVGVRNLGDLADAAGISWAAFLESMPTPCNKQLNWAIGYTPAHNPFTMYKDIANNALRCEAHDLTWTSWQNDVTTGSIPNYAFITPNTWHDDHNNTIAVGDAWLKAWLSPLINDTAIFSTTAFILTFDESAGTPQNTPVVNGAAGGHVYTVVVSPYSRQLSSDRFYTTYSVLTTTEWLLGLPGGTLGSNDSWSVRPPMTDLFSFASPPSPHDVTFSESGLPSGTNWSVTLGGVTESTTGSSLSFSELDGTYDFSLGFVDGYSASPSSGSVTVHGSAVTRKVAFSPLTYAVTFSETGLPSGTEWSVTLDGVTHDSTDSSIAFYQPGGTYAYSVATVAGYASSPSKGSVAVADGPVLRTINFTVVRYALTFDESGLPSGTIWSVTLGDSTQNSSNSSITFGEPNGTHAYSIAAVPGYLATPVSGSLEVAGTPVSQRVEFTAVLYDVTFTEVGLPEGSAWSVAMSGSIQRATDTTLTFREPNGTYAYTVGGPAGYAAPSSGTVTVHGSAVLRSLPFSQVTYRVTISEQGLPVGAAWSMTLNGSTQNATGSTVTFTLPNGTFAYTVGPVAGYSATPRTGSVTVNGSAVARTVSFSQITYAVTFVPAGLPIGGHWSVTVGGVTQSSTASRLSFPEPNGTFPYSAESPDGYTASPSSFSVAGGPLVVSVTFDPVTYAVSFSADGLPSGTNWSVTLTSDNPTSILVTPYSTGPGPVTRWSTSPSTVPFFASNGSYSYRASAPGYADLAGNLTVLGEAPSSVGLSFLPISSHDLAVPFLAYGLAAPVALGAVLVAVALAVLVRRSSRPPRAPTTPPGTGGVPPRTP